MSETPPHPTRQDLELVAIPVVRVQRRGDRCSISDLAIDIRCKRLATVAAGAEHTLRSAARALAAQPENRDPEQLAHAAALYCMTRLGRMERVEVEVRVRGWGHLDIAGRPRAGDLVAADGLIRVARISLTAERERVGAGFRDLVLLSPNDTERGSIELLRLHAHWYYGWPEVPYDTQWQQVRRAVVEAYAELDRARADLPLSLAQAVLAESPAVEQVVVRLERTRRTAIDMSVYGMENDGTMYGTAEGGRFVQEARVRREEMPA